MTKYFNVSLRFVAVFILVSRAYSQCSDSPTCIDCCACSYNDSAATVMQELIRRINIEECELVNNTEYRDDDLPDDEDFDFIIVGAGASGSVVANRLSENADWRVLLLEAGGDPALTTEIPNMAALAQNTDADWQYKTVPSDTYCLSSQNRSCVWPRGKVIGGSTSLNFMLSVRGQREDYDGWESLGNTGWCYDCVLPYFIKSENMTIPRILNNSNLLAIHGTDGPLSIEEFFVSEAEQNLENIVYAAFGEVGIKAADPDDVNTSNFTNGVYRVYGTLENGRRCSAAKAFLKSPGSNLLIVKNSFVTKILIDTDNNNTAYGVLVKTKDGSVKTINASKEVIVSAGAINSAQLLLLSGIGPSDHLTDLGIDVIKNASVGNNLQDHVLVRPILFSLASRSTTSSDSLTDMFQFLTNSTGPLAGNGELRTKAYITVGSDPTPDIEIYFFLFPWKSVVGIPQAAGLGANYITQVTDSVMNINNMTDVLLVSPTALRPRSRGQLRLQSDDAEVYPLIDANYFGDEDDLNRLMESIKFIRKLENTTAFQSVGATYQKVNVPNCDNLTDGTDEYYKCLIRNLGATSYHPVGTCKMGNSSDPEAVVDHDLKVYGINNLRVCDAGIMPNIISGNTMLPAIMIGEKGADAIKKQWSS